MAHIIPPPGKATNVKPALREKIKAFIESKYSEIEEAAAECDIEKTIALICDTGEKLYRLNQWYTSDFLEMTLLYLSEKLTKNAATAFEAKDNVVLYYDLPALQDHSLTKVYLETLGELGFDIVYTIPFGARDKIPKLRKIIEKYNGKIETFARDTYLITYRQISDIIFRNRPKYAFFYSYPSDAPGILAFMRFKGSVTRYFFDITDHAFWLGRHSFDYIMQGRDYGASIAHLYRGIPREKIIEIHDSLEFWDDPPFEGYPFRKNDDDFIIFSGGGAYKTIDDNLTFYNIAANILHHHKNVKFWYAGLNGTAGMKNLSAAFPNRVFNTPERGDILAVLRNTDLYLNTYPMFGGTMMRLAAFAGRVPFTLRFNDEADGMLKNQEYLGIVFDTPEALFNAIHRFIRDKNYRKELEDNMKNTFYTKAEMKEFLKNDLLNPKPYDFKLYEPKTEDFRGWYLNAFANEFKGA